MKEPTRFTIQVTEQDIKRAHVNDSYKCVVAQALARTIKDATRIEVDTQTIRFTHRQRRLAYLTPFRVQQYVVAFDAGEPIEPFSFTIREPARVARVVLTEEGKLAHRVYNRQRADKANAKVSSAPAQSKSRAKPIPPGEYKNRTTKVSDGPQSPPRVFKMKTRTYGHRILRINREGGALVI